MELDKLNKLFRALSDGTRLRILNLIIQKELCVCEIFGILKLPQSKVSRHLTYLRKTGIVETRRSGQMIFYFLTESKDEVYAALIRCLKQCFKQNVLLQKDINKIKGVCK